MAHSLIFSLLRLAFGLVWIGALVVMWAGFWVGSEEPQEVRSLMHIIALVLTLVSVACAVVGWLCGRLMGGRGWIAALVVASVGAAFIPYAFGEAPSLASLVVALPVVLPPALFGFMTGWRRRVTRRR
jgi:hypothetical protein